jgi:hypothetical protein
MRRLPRLSQKSRLQYRVQDCPRQGQERRLSLVSVGLEQAKPVTDGNLMLLAAVLRFQNQEIRGQTSAAAL